MSNRLGTALVARARANTPAVVTAAIAPLLIWFAYSAPLTYDEAYNWRVYRPRGWWTIATSYDLPNNHVPFTLLHVLIPARAVSATPWALRSISLLIALALVFTVLRITRRVGASAAVPILLVLASPLLLTYLIVARSYAAGSLLVVAAVYAVATQPGRRPWVLLAAAGLALASWAVPTNAFVVPGWLTLVAVLSGRQLALLAMVTYSALTAAFFAPIATDVLEQSKRQWAAGDNAVTHLASHASFVPLALGAVVAVILVDGFRRWTRNGPLLDLRHRSLRGRLAVGAAMMVVSWFIVLVVGWIGGMQLPFNRNAVPVLWLAILALVAAFPTQQRLRWLTTAMLVPGALVGVIAIWSATQDGRWDRMSSVLSGTTPVSIRDLDEIDADHLSCGRYDVPVCFVAEPMLARAGISVGRTEVPPRDDLRCAIGERRPDPLFEAIVYRNGEELGVLCN